MQILLRAILILLLLIAAVVLSILLYRRVRPLRNAHFICPNCGEVTSPGKLMLALSPTRADCRFMQCPACGKFGYMPPVWDAP